MQTTLGHLQRLVWSRVRAIYRGPDRRRDLQPLPMRYTVRPAVTARSDFIAALSNPDLVAIAIFCAIGLLATINVMLRVPAFGIM